MAVPSGETMNVFSSHSGPSTCGQFLPDGKRLLTGSADGSLVLWDPRTAEPVHKLVATDGRFSFEGGITSLAVNGASTSAIVGGADGQSRIVNLNSGQVVQNLERHTKVPNTSGTIGDQQEIEVSVEQVVWAPSASGGGAGLWISAGIDGSIKIFEASNGSLRWSGNHDDAVTSLVLHPAPRSHLVTTGCADRLLRTWDLRTGTLIQTHTGHRDVVHAVSISSDGSRLVSASDDGTARVFEIPN